jgi:hypothetical protein
MDATLQSMKRTLQENPALMPPTSDAPATFDGSLHPGHAISEGTRFIQRRPSNETSRNILRI